MIRNVVFDMGGVLIDYDPEKTLYGLFDAPTAQLMLREIFRNPIWGEKDRGTVTPAEILAQKRAVIPPAHYDRVAAMVENYYPYMPPFPEPTRDQRVHPDRRADRDRDHQKLQRIDRGQRVQRLVRNTERLRFARGHETEIVGRDIVDGLISSHVRSSPKKGMCWRILYRTTNQESRQNRLKNGECLALSSIDVSAFPSHRANRRPCAARRFAAPAAAGCRG